MFSHEVIDAIDAGINMQTQIEMLRAYWERTEPQRRQVVARLVETGVARLELSTFLRDMDGVSRPRITAESEQRAMLRLVRDMNDPKSAEFNGFYLLDIGKALRNEARLAQALQSFVDPMPYRQMAAFKANHSLVLQAARLLEDPNAGLEVASAPEVVAACSVGFNPENIIFANPTINAREFLTSAWLGVTAFCFDHLDKLRLLLKTADEHGIDKSKLRLIARLSTPYADASLTMQRFGIDVLKNEPMVVKMLDLLKASRMLLGGASFHVGIGARNHVAYEYAFDSVQKLFELSRAKLGHLPRVVNVGGGIASTDTSHRHFGAMLVADQIAALGRGLRKLRNALGEPFEVWSELGQGYVGSAGSLFARIDFHELRENPRRKLMACPLVMPGQMLWSRACKEIFAEYEQRLVAHVGGWSVGVNRYTTLYPEIWAMDEHGTVEKLDYDESRLVPTTIFGKTCDSADTLNPVQSGEIVHLLLPRLSEYGAKTFWMRLGSAAYMDTGGEFNWQTTSFFPTHYVVNDESATTQSTPDAHVLMMSADGQFEYRDRLLARNQLTSAQIHQAKRLVAEQFMEREQMISWLRRHGRLGSDSDLEMLQHLFWELVSDCVDNGLSIARLRVHRDAPDSEGQVIAVVCVKVLRKEDRPELPLRLTNDIERHRLLPVLGVEAIALRRVYRIDDALQEKIFPMAYVAMSAAKPNEGSPVRALRVRVIELAQGASGIKSVGALSTGKRSSDIWESIPECAKLLRIPYDDVTLFGDKPFAGIKFGEEKGELRFFIRDMRGPHRFSDVLPLGQRLVAHVHAEAHLLEAIEMRSSGSPESFRCA